MAARSEVISARRFRGSRRVPRSWRRRTSHFGKVWGKGSGGGGRYGRTHCWSTARNHRGRGRSRDTKWTTIYGWRASQAGTAGCWWVAALSATTCTQYPRGTRAATYVRNCSQSMTRLSAAEPAATRATGGTATA